DRVRRRITANDESISAHGDDRQLQSNLHECAAPGHELRAGVVDESNAAEELVGQVMESDATLLLQRLRVSKKIEAHRDDLRRPQCIRRKHLLSAVKLIELDVGEVDRRPLARRRRVARLAVNLYRSRAAAQRARKYLDVAVDGQAPGECRSGNDRPETLHREDTIDRQAEHACRGVAIVNGRNRCEDRLAEVVEAGAGDAAHRYDRFSGEKTSGDQLLDLETYQLDDVGLHEIAFRNR